MQLALMEASASADLVFAICSVWIFLWQDNGVQSEEQLIRFFGTVARLAFLLPKKTILAFLKSDFTFFLVWSLFVIFEKKFTFCFWFGIFYFIVLFLTFLRWKLWNPNLKPEDLHFLFSSEPTLFKRNCWNWNASKICSLKKWSIFGNL